LAFYVFYGMISDVGGSVNRHSLVIDHTCGNRLCINPMHLEEVLQSENVRRAFDYHCPGCNCHSASANAK